MTLEISKEDLDTRSRRIIVLTLREYWTALRHHDWYYEYSDDNNVWRRGRDKETELNIMAENSPAHNEIWEAFTAWSRDGMKPELLPPFPLRYLCDNARHMVCEPYSLENLHRMASALGIKRAWFHKSRFPHYDMPKKRIAELTAQCERMSQKQILLIIRAGVK
jgi:hypothetical protein